MEIITYLGISAALFFLAYRANGMGIDWGMPYLAGLGFLGWVVWLIGEKVFG
jgi:hypothetical protein